MRKCKTTMLNSLGDKSSLFNKVSEEEYNQMLDEEGNEPLEGDVLFSISSRGKKKYRNDSERYALVKNLEIKKQDLLDIGDNIGAKKLEGLIDNVKKQMYIINEKWGEYRKMKGVDKQSIYEDIQQKVEDLDKVLLSENLDLMLENGRKVISRLRDKIQNLNVLTKNEEGLRTIRDELKMWQDVATNFFTEQDLLEDVDNPFLKQIQEVENEANQVERLYQAKMREYYLTHANKYTIEQLVNNDLKEIEDSSIFGYTLDLSRSVDKLSRSIDAILKHSARQVELDFAETVFKPIENFKERFKEAGMDFYKVGKSFINKGELVTMIDGKYYEERSSQRELFMKTLKNFAGKNNKRERDVATLRYAKWQRDNSVMANYSALFENNEDEKTKEIERLKQILGEQFDSFYNKVEKEYQAYENTRKAVLDKYNGDETNTNYLAFVQKYSPTIAYKLYSAKNMSDLPKGFYTNQSGNKVNRTIRTANYRFVTTIPVGDKWYNKKYKEIKSNSLTSEYYDYVVKTLNRFKYILPAHALEDKGANYLFEINKNTLEDVIQEGGVKGHISKPYAAFLDFFAMSSITADENKDLTKKINPITKQVVDSIPVNYTTNNIIKLKERLKLLNKELEELQDVISGAKDERIEQLEQAIENVEKELEEAVNSKTDDMERILYVIGAMALNYQHKSDVENLVLIGKEIVNDAAVIQRNAADKRVADYTGKYLSLNNGQSATKELVNYTIQAQLYNKRYNVEGVLKGKVMTKEDEKKKVVLEQKIEQLEKEVEEGNEDVVEELEETKKQYNEVGSNVALSKVADKFITWTQLKSIGFNPFTATAQLGFGVLSNYVWAAGGDDLTFESMNKAFGIMLSAFRDKKLAKKVNILVEKFGLLDNLTSYRADKFTFNPYFLVRSADYFIKGMTLVSSLLTKNEQGVSLWELFDDNGKYIGENKEEYSELSQTPNKFNRLLGEVKQLSKSIHGNTDDASPLIIKKWVVGRLLGQFRLSWIPEGFYTRFAEERYDEMLGKNVKGRWLSVYHIYQQTGIINTGKAMVQSIFAKSQLDSTLANSSQLDRANLQRTAFEMMFYLSLYAFIFGLEHLLDDEDEKGFKWKSLMLNQINRVRQDIAFYFSPSEFKKIIKEPIPALKTLENFVNITEGVTNYAMSKYNNENTNRYDEEYLAKKLFSNIPLANLPIKISQQTDKLYEK